MSTMIIDKIKPQKIGKTPVVVLSLEKWHEIEDALEEYTLMTSPSYLKSVQKAREDLKRGRVYEFNAKTGKFRSLRRK